MDVLGRLVDQSDHVVLGLWVHSHRVEILDRTGTPGLDPLHAQPEGLAGERRGVLDVDPQVVGPGALPLGGEPQHVVAHPPGVVSPGLQRR